MILILGYGLLGRHLSASFQARGMAHAVAGNDEDVPASLPFHFLEYSQIDRYRDVFHGYHTVIHLIHTTVPMTSYIDPLKDATENVDNSLRFLQILREEKTVRRLIYISSGGAVYGFPTTEPVAEDHPLNPVSPYGMSKAYIERQIMRYPHREDFEFTILRPSNVYGLHPRAIREQGIVSQILAALKNDAVLDIWGSGQGRKDYLYIDDFTNAFHAVLAQSGTAAGRVFNLASGQPYSVLDIVEAAERITGRKIARVHTEQRPFDVNDIVLDGRAFERVFDWKAQHELEAALTLIFKKAGL